MTAPTLPKLPHKEVFTSSRQLLPGSRLNSIEGQLNSYAEVVALAGGTLVTATPVLNAANVNLTTVATANDSVCLPSAQPGLQVAITNSGAASAQVFGTGTDTIQGTAGNVGVALANGATAIYRCIKPGAWNRFVSA